MRVSEFATRAASIFALLLVASQAAAQESAVLSLTTLDHETGAPLADVTVRLPTLGIGSISDTRGQVRLSRIPAGTHLVDVRRIGYGPVRLVLGFEAGGLVEGEVDLVLEPVQIEPVHAVVEGHSRKLDMVGFYERKRDGFGTFLTREEIERRSEHTSDVTRVLHGIPGLRLDHVPGGRGYAITSGRGAASLRSTKCFSQIFLDGQRLQPDPPRLGQPFPYVDLARLVGAQEVEAIEWYRGGATVPEQFKVTGSKVDYGPDCGVLLIWTRG